jgi:N-acetyl-anhydromuramyl-L-alanine amidase AmpD
MDFKPDYKMGVAWPASETNLGYPRSFAEDSAHQLVNQPRAFVLHTAEEPADPHSSTPLYFDDPNRSGSTHYFISHAGGCYQMVPERLGAWANALQGKPRPAWADPNRNLNLQTLSVEIEGYAGSIGQTMPPGCPQWKALVALVQDRCTHYAIPLDHQHIIGHYEVSNQRSDPGAGFVWDVFILDVQQARKDEVFLAVVKMRANLVMLANQDRWQEIADALAYIGVRPK